MMFCDRCKHGFSGSGVIPTYGTVTIYCDLLDGLWVGTVSDPWDRITPPKKCPRINTSEGETYA